MLIYQTYEFHHATYFTVCFVTVWDVLSGNCELYPNSLQIKKSILVKAGYYSCCTVAFPLGNHVSFYTELGLYLQG